MSQFLSCNSADFREKEVVNINDGRCLGNVSEIEFEVCEGRLTAIIVSGQGGFLGFCPEEIRIPWCRIRKIGEDVILVDAEGCLPPPCDKKRRRRNRGCDHPSCQPAPPPPPPPPLSGGQGGNYKI